MTHRTWTRLQKQKPYLVKEVVLESCSFNENPHLPVPEAVVEPADLVLFACPTCGNVSEGTRPTIALDLLDKKTWCNSCRCSRFVRLWRCECGVPWHACPKHMGEPARIRAKRASVVTVTVQRGRASSSNARQPQVRRDSNGLGLWLDAPPTKQARTFGSTVIFSRKECDRAARGNTVNPRCLSAGLKRKFAHLLTE